MPISFAATCVTTPVDRWRIVTLAAGTTALDGSVTVPDRIAPTTCPNATCVGKVTRAASKTADWIADVRMKYPSELFPGERLVPISSLSGLWYCWYIEYYWTLQYSKMDFFRNTNFRRHYLP